jgi:Na+-driven multidrug efflux pump
MKAIWKRELQGYFYTPVGYVFMGVSLAIQGILQAYRKSIAPLSISLLRLLVFLVPSAFLFIYRDDATSSVWWAFPIAETLTSFVAVLILVLLLKKRGNKVGLESENN